MSMKMNYENTKCFVLKICIKLNLIVLQNKLKRNSSNKINQVIMF